MACPIMRELLWLVDRTPLQDVVYNHIIRVGLYYGDAPDGWLVDHDWLVGLNYDQLIGLAQVLFNADGYPTMWMLLVDSVGHELLNRIALRKHRCTATALIEQLMPHASPAERAGSGPFKALERLNIAHDPNYSEAVRNVVGLYVLYRSYSLAVSLH